jgi:hypothetical protein
VNVSDTGLENVNYDVTPTPSLERDSNERVCEVKVKEVVASCPSKGNAQQQVVTSCPFQGDVQQETHTQKQLDESSQVVSSHVSIQNQLTTDSLKQHEQSFGLPPFSPSSPLPIFLIDLDEHILPLTQLRDPFLKTIFQKLRSSNSISNHTKNFTLKNNILYRLLENGKTVPAIPERYSSLLLSQISHEKLPSLYWWQNMPDFSPPSSDFETHLASHPSSPAASTLSLEDPESNDPRAHHQSDSTCHFITHIDFDEDIFPQTLSLSKHRENKTKTL